MQDSSETTPTRYGILLSIMREYGWSWADLMNAPADLVQEIGIRLQADNHWRNTKREFDAQMAEQGR
jgi:hypothetical protein